MLFVKTKINTTLQNNPKHQYFVNMEAQYLFFIDVKFQYIINTKPQHQQNISTPATSICSIWGHQQSNNAISTYIILYRASSEV